MTNEVMSVEILVPISEVLFEGHSISIYGTYENPLFLAKDVAIWIQYDVSSINKMLKNVDEDEKVRRIVPTPSGAQESWLLTEQGVYEVLFQSRKPVAKECKKVVKAHMKELRTTGVTLGRNLSIQQQTSVLLNKLDELLFQQESEIAQLHLEVDMLNEQTDQIQDEISLIDTQIKELQPYAKKYKEFLAEDALMTIDDFARIMHPRYNLGRNRLFKWMRNKRMLGSEGNTRNMPHKQLVKRNILKVLKNQVFITKKGFDYLCGELDKHFNL